MDKIFDYYYGIEAEQFSFYRIPRQLIKDKRFKCLSSDAKLLYGLMLDRMSMSMKNGWFDKENRVYIIYTIDNIIDDLGCKKDKAIKVLSELDSEKGIGLIEKIRRGQGKPAIIYVKNFISFSDDTNKQHNDDITSTSAISSDFGKIDFKTSEKPTSRSLKNRILEVGKTASNYNNNNYNNINYINPIYQSKPNDELDKQNRLIDEIDPIDETDTYMQIIKNNIQYDYHMQHDNPERKELIDELYNLICEVVCVKRKSIKISGVDYPHNLVKAKFLKLNDSHLLYVIECMQRTTTEIGNIKAYMITALYNASSTMSHFYQQQAQHDLYGIP